MHTCVGHDTFAFWVCFSVQDVRVFVRQVQQVGDVGNAIVLLSLQGSADMVLPVHIGGVGSITPFHLVDYLPRTGA
jgi:hypothetical protein